MDKAWAADLAGHEVGRPCPGVSAMPDSRFGRSSERQNFENKVKDVVAVEVLIVPRLGEGVHYLLEGSC